MKKLFAVLVALALVLTMGTTFALAAETTGTITITKAYPGSEYKVFKMLNFTPNNAAGDKGIYTIVDGWADFFNKAPATDYFKVVTVGEGDEAQTTVVLKDGVTAVDQKLAKAALNYATEKSIAAVATSTAPAAEEGKDRSEVKFTGLDLGYYVIDTSAGTMTALTRATNEVTAAEKNEMPNIDKEVQEDKDNTWGKVNDADIDQVVNYKSTITVGLEAVNYIMHDTMEKGLTFNNDVVVKVGDKVYENSDTVTYYTVNTNPGDGHTFDVVFENSFISTLAKNDQITVYYSAILNENAYIGPEKGNDNTVYLTAGEKNEWETAEHKTSTYTWMIDVFKYTAEGTEDKTPLAGAKFQLLDKDGKAIKFSEVADKDVPTYRVDADGTTDTITTTADGKFEIVGLDEGVYKLHETEAPKGYNKLANDITVNITSTHYDETLKAEYAFSSGEGEATKTGTIEVENKSGGLFPETGGIGTVIFYVIGGLLMLGAFVFLVSKKRMASFA